MGIVLLYGCCLINIKCVQFEFIDTYHCTNDSERM